MPNSAPIPAVTPLKRRRKGSLERALVQVCNMLITGQLEDSFEVLTPTHASHIIANVEAEFYAKRSMPPRYPPPSPGAVTNVLRKWRDCGYAEIQEAPLAFVKYTDAAYEPGINCADDLIARTKSLLVASDDDDD